MAIYASSEVHVTTPRAADMLGMGESAVRMIPVDDGYRMRVDALRDAIRRDRDAGVRPVAVVGTAGTVSTGAIDPLEGIADVCAAEGLWFHVDGAYGGPAVLADDLRPLFAGIERADSIAFKRNIANRLWAHLMGQGIVNPVDKTHTGNPPSHPELLELLGEDVAAHKFDLKWLLRELCLSKTYQRAFEATRDRQYIFRAEDAKQRAAQMQWQR